MSSRVISRGTWLCGEYGSGDADTSGQLPSGSGSSIPSHMRRVEPLRPAWASWSAIRASVWRVDEVDDAPPRVDVLRLVHPGAARADAPLAAHVGHLGDHQRGAADRAAAEMHEVPVVRRAVLGRVLAHRRHDDAVREDAGPRSRNGVNIGRRTRAGGAGSGTPLCCAAPSANHRSTVATNRGSRTLRLSCVTRRLRVRRLKANWIGSRRPW